LTFSFSIYLNQKCFYIVQFFFNIELLLIFKAISMKIYFDGKGSLKLLNLSTTYFNI